ncbi:glutathione S-transferase zeta class-like isoform X1 [Iris pallida]|uniref:Glutathione S-transferase zeta class-like isoform X1 n=1 Tax=Iris pallida TaxID=29817 RepID=A0AAX6DMK1_IRIPA|nr:glutathione S-transferase zeta class-like isoform X1 [Iris pallida]
MKHMPSYQHSKLLSLKDSPMHLRRLCSMIRWALPKNYQQIKE